MIDAPATPTEDVGREMDVIQAPGEHRVSTDVCVVAMDPSAEKAGTTGRRKMSYDNFNSFPFLEIIVH